MKRKQKILFAIQLILVTGLIFNQLTAKAQTIPEADTSGQLPDSIMQYITPLEYAFMMHEETSWLVKGFLSTNSLSEDVAPSFKVSFEQRLSTAFTIDATIAESSNDILFNMPSSDIIRFLMETRWYYRLKKRLQKSHIAKNMSENYFSVGVYYSHYYEFYPEYYDYRRNYWSVQAKWGFQRRLLHHGITDMGFRSAITFSAGTSNDPSFTFNTYVDLGLAFTKDTYKLNREKLCSVLKCYESQKFLLKTDFSQLINIGLFQNDLLFKIAPQIAFEYKLGKTPFSINTLLDAGYEFLRYTRWEESEIPLEPLWEDHAEIWDYIIEMEGRWYYNLNRRMLKGKSGNGLSASYLAFGSNYHVQTTNWRPDNYSYTHIYIVTGWQRLFSEHMYYDIQFGFESNPRDIVYFYDARLKISYGFRF
ncbi:MAG: hypothetical protein KDC05_17540 [Bacteroidales bacterium]|nr:hypothetical protein [Bacteroidales bacterium]